MSCSGGERPLERTLRTINFPKDVRFRMLWNIDRANIPPPPEELRVVPSDAVRVKDVGFAGRCLALSLFLVNASSKELEVALFGYYISSREEHEPGIEVTVSRTGGFLEPASGEHLSRKPHEGPPLPQQAPPPPMLVTVPGGTRIEFEAILDLDQYVYTPGAEAELVWTFCFWSVKGLSGRVRAVLPERRSGAL
jgi:hypothetical protein